MAARFEFYSTLSVTKYTGFWAESARALARGVARVPGGSIYYHLHHALFRRHFTTAEFMNDFARWVWVTLREEALAERLAAIDPLEFVSVRDARSRLSAALQEFLGQAEFVLHVPPAMRFHFLDAQTFVYSTGIVATGLAEFRDLIRRVGPDVIFHHFVVAPLRLGRRDNDFSVWLEQELGEAKRADRVRALSPYSTDIWTLRDVISETIA